MVDLKLHIQVIAILEFGWSVFALICILQYIPEYLKTTGHLSEIVHWLHIGSFLAAVVTSVLQFVSSVLLSLASIRLIFNHEDVTLRLKYVEGWESLAGWRIALLLPSIFPVLSDFVVLKASELFITIATLGVVHNYRVELRRYLSHPVNELPPSYESVSVETPAVVRICRLLRLRVSLNEGSGRRGGRLVGGEGDLEEVDAERSGSLAESEVPPPYEEAGGVREPPAYEGPPKYDEIIFSEEKLPHVV